MDTSSDTLVTRALTDITRYIWMMLFMWTAVTVGLFIFKSSQTTVSSAGVIWIVGIAGILVSGHLFRKRAKDHG